MKTMEVEPVRDSRNQTMRTHDAVRPPTWLVLAAFAAVYLIWGSTYLGIRMAIDSFPPLLMSGGRFLIAGLALYFIIRLRGALRPSLLHWRDATIVGALLLLLGNGAVSWAEQTVPTNMTALIIAGTPLWINLIDWLRPEGHRPRSIVFVGLVLGFIGVSMIVVSRNLSGERLIDPVGGSVLLVASLCWALGSIFSRHARKPDSGLLSVAMQMIAGGCLLLVVGALMGESTQFDPAKVTAKSLWAFAYLTAIGSLVGFTAYIWLLQVSTPARVSTYAYVNPFIAVVLGSLVLDEVLPRSVLIAGALIIAAVILITSRSSDRSHA